MRARGRVPHPLWGAVVDVSGSSSDGPLTPFAISTFTSPLSNSFPLIHLIVSPLFLDESFPLEYIAHGYNCIWSAAAELPLFSFRLANSTQIV